MKNQRKAAEGISWATVALRLISWLTRSTPMPTRSTKLITKKAIRTGEILEMLILSVAIGYQVLIAESIEFCR
jgi:hypothetical protein